METKGILSAKAVKTSLKPVEETKTYFQDVANQYLEEQRLCGNYDTFKSDTTRLKRLFEFTQNPKLEFEEITVDLLQRYLVFLRVSKKFQYDKKNRQTFKRKNDHQSPDRD